MVAKVILNSNTLSTDRLYDYSVPEHLSSYVDVGKRVKVPFGKGNKTKEAYIHSLIDSSEYSNLKEISEIINEMSYFDKRSVELIEFMRHRYFCSYISAVRCLIPAGLNLKIASYFILSDTPYDEIKKGCSRSATDDKIVSCLNAYGKMSEEALKIETGKTSIVDSLRRLEKKGYIKRLSSESETVSDTVKTFVSLAVDRGEAYNIIDIISKKAPARARVLEILCENYDVELSDLLIYASTSRSTVDALVEKGLIALKTVSCFENEISYNESYINDKPQLTETQQNVASKVSDAICSPSKSAFLLHGVTGSGKTEVYLSLIESSLKCGKDSIFLVPEISLTPQMIAQIFGRFGDNVAVLHSKLTVKQRYNEWNKIKNGDVKIVVGARSAIFAPFKNVGLIIIDEEHETTYKSEMSPRYNAIEVARFISGQTGATLLLASATPAVDDYFKAQNGYYELLEMPERISKTGLPEIDIVDMRQELSNGNMSIFSSALKEAISQTIEKKEQFILFLNRRGFSGFVSCRDCGYVSKCPKCNVSLTFHKTVNKMVCHYCDYKAPVERKCPSCSGEHIRFFGIGTEKIVDELIRTFPGIRVLRMDADTTSGKMGHENILNNFKEGKADVLVGTQMITKGLDFENLTLVGIIAADMSLNVDDYRASERTFDLITQVAGRAGRSKKKGRAIIQTYNPDDETIILSSCQDYKSFYNQEITVRQMLFYPPFSEFIKIQFSGSKSGDVKEVAMHFRTDLLEGIEENDIVFSGEVFSVSEAPLFRINGKYRYRFMIKTPYKKNFYELLHRIYNDYTVKNDDIAISVDVNPISTN